MRQRMELRLPAPLLEKLGEYAESRRRTRTSVVEEALECFLESDSTIGVGIQTPIPPEQWDKPAPEKDLPKVAKRRWAS